MLIAFYCTHFVLVEGDMVTSQITRNVSGKTKKGITMAMVFIGQAAGNLITPKISRAKMLPDTCVAS
jgi:hypothetical protein